MLLTCSKVSRYLSISFFPPGKRYWSSLCFEPSLGRLLPRRRRSFRCGPSLTFVVEPSALFLHQILGLFTYPLLDVFPHSVVANSLMTFQKRYMNGKVLKPCVNIRQFCSSLTLNIPLNSCSLLFVLYVYFRIELCHRPKKKALEMCFSE